MPLVSALRLVTARHRGVLLPYLELEFDHLGIGDGRRRSRRPRSISSARRWPTRWKASTTAVARPKSCGPTTAACSFTASPMAAAFYLLRHDLRSAKAAISASPGRRRRGFRHGDFGQQRVGGRRACRLRCDCRQGCRDRRAGRDGADSQGAPGTRTGPAQGGAVAEGGRQNSSTAAGTRRRTDADRDLPGPGARGGPAGRAADARRIGRPGRGARARTLGSSHPDRGRRQ